MVFDSIGRPSCRPLHRGQAVGGGHKWSLRNLRAFPTTDTELKLIAAAAIIGLNTTPQIGYSAPAAIGIPNTL